MSPRTNQSGREADTGVLDASLSERERIFALFRRWGYLEADLDPLGFLKPYEHPELRISGQVARQARGFYCGTIGVEFMHIPDPERRQWIQRQMEGEPPTVADQDHVLDLLIRADLFEQVRQQRY